MSLVVYAPASTANVSVGFDTKVAPRLLTIGINKSEGQLKDAKVYLVDNLLNRTHDLQKSDYSFEQSETGEFADRFTLTFSKSNKGGNGNGNGNGRSLVISNKVESLKIDAEEPVMTIKVYDIFGRLIEERSPNSKSFSINTQKVKPGTVLILESVMEDGTVINKKAIRY